MSFEELLDKQNYQSLPQPVLRLLNERGVRYEEPQTHTDTLDEERLNFLLSRVSPDLIQRGAVDIGANSGYFTISLADFCSGQMIAIEGDTQFVAFIEAVTKELGLSSKIRTNAGVFGFSDIDKHSQGLVLCLNVLHHVGRYFDQSVTNREDAKLLMGRYLCNLVTSFEGVFFQIGYNWKGDSTKPLFENGLKSEVIDFVRESLDSIKCKIHIGIYSHKEKMYVNPSDLNLTRFDEQGEFKNRPLFYIERQ